jgi:hypothetical protein
MTWPDWVGILVIASLAIAGILGVYLYLKRD